MVLLPLLLALVQAPDSTTPDTVVPRLDVRVFSPVMRQWSLMYREFKTEFLQCMYGPIEHNDDGGATLVVSVAINANVPPKSSRKRSAGKYDADSTDVGPCPWKYTTWTLLGIAHNHIKEKVSAWDRFQPHTNPENLCELSTTDYLTLHKEGYFLAVIVCAEDKFAVYTRFSGFKAVECTFDPEEAIPNCKEERGYDR